MTASLQLFDRDDEHVTGRLGEDALKQVGCRGPPHHHEFRVEAVHLRQNGACGTSAEDGLFDADSGREWDLTNGGEHAPQLRTSTTFCLAAEIDDIGAGRPGDP